MNLFDNQQLETTTGTLSAETTIERFIPPRLGIIHLLAWIGTSAVMMKLVTWGGWFGSMSERFPGWMKLFFVANTYFNLTLIAAGIVGTCVVIHYKYRGHTGHLQAGHWLVMNITISAIMSTALFAVFTIANALFHARNGPGNSPISFNVLFAGQAVPRLITAALWLLAAIRAREPSPWKALLGFLALRSASTGMLHLLTALSTPSSLMSGSVFQLPIGAALILMFLSVAVMTDLSHNKKRDWLHWLGIAMLFITSISRVAESVVSLSFFHGSFRDSPFN